MFRKRRKSAVLGKNKKKLNFRFSFSRFKRKKKTSSKFLVFGSRVNFWKRFFVQLSYVALFLLFIGLIFVFFFTSFFVIENINLERENLRVDTGKVVDSLKDYRYRNILLISTRQIEKQIKKQFPEYKTVNVKRVFPKSLMIQVKNFEIIAQVKIYIKPQSSITEFQVETVELKPYEQILALNSEGIIEQNNPDFESLPFLEVSGIVDIPLVQGDRLIMKKHLDLILDAKKILSEEIGISVDYIYYFPEAKEVHLRTETENKYQVWIDFTTPIAEQIDKLKKISNHVDWNENPPESHIDLRVKNRIIYK